MHTMADLRSYTPLVKATSLDLYSLSKGYTLKNNTHLVWAKLRSIMADPRSARPGALATEVLLRLSTRRAFQEEQTAVRASSSNAGTAATLSHCSRTSRARPWGRGGCFKNNQIVKRVGVTHHSVRQGGHGATHSLLPRGDAPGAVAWEGPRSHWVQLLHSTTTPVGGSPLPKYRRLHKIPHQTTTNNMANK